MKDRIGMAYKALKVKDFSNAMAAWLLNAAMVALVLAVVAAVFSKEAHWAVLLVKTAVSLFVGMLMCHGIAAVSAHAIKLCGWSEVELEGMRG